MSQPKKKRLCLANKPTDSGVLEVTSATGEKVLCLQLTQTGTLWLPLPLRPPLQPPDFFKRISSFSLSFYSFYICSLFCSADCFSLVKSGALFLLPKSMKLFKVRTHKERMGVGLGKGVE